MTTWQEWLNENTNSVETLNEKVSTEKVDNGWKTGVLQKPIKAYNVKNHQEIHSIPKGSVVTFKDKRNGEGSMLSHNKEDGTIVAHHSIPARAKTYITQHADLKESINESDSTFGEGKLKHDMVATKVTVKGDIKTSVPNHVIKKGTPVDFYHTTHLGDRTAISTKKVHSGENEHSYVIAVKPGHHTEHVENNIHEAIKHFDTGSAVPHIGTGNLKSDIKTTQFHHDGTTKHGHLISHDVKDGSLNKGTKVRFNYDSKHNITFVGHTSEPKDGIVVNHTKALPGHYSDHVE